MSLPGAYLYGLGLTGAKRRLKSRAAPVSKKALAPKRAQRTLYEGSCPVNLVVGGNLIQMQWK
jgi:hypothetical protein